MDGLYHTILDREELQDLQNVFCRAAGIYAFCVDAGGMDMTQMSGDETDRVRLAECVPREKLLSLFRRVSASGLEDQAIEDTDIDALKYAAVSVKVEGQTALTWLVYGVLSDAPSAEGAVFAESFRCQIPEQQFNRALDLLREVSRHIVCGKIQAESARAESLRSRSIKEAMEDGVRRSTAMTEIVQLLDSDAPIEGVMANILGVIGSFLKIDCAYLCSVSGAQEGYMDVIAQWCGEGMVSVFERTGNQRRPSWMYREKPLVLSSSAGREDYGQDMKEAGIQALAVLPILLKDRIGMYACFAVTGTAHDWKVEEIKFLNDSVKVLQSILTKRIWKNSLAGSYAALEEVLDNVGSAVYVRNKKEGKILFANRRLRSQFGEEMEENRLSELFESGIPEGRKEGSLEVCMEDKGDWYELFYKNITWVDGSQVLVCSIHDVTEKKMNQRKIERQAYTDFLTGLYNRHCCERDLTKYVEAAKSDGREGAVLYLDLDDFKHINDCLGHQYGDVLLKSIAHGMRNVQGIRDSCYRMGGDEFVIIVPPNCYAMLDEIIEEVKTVFGRPWFLKDANYYCTMSMGVVHFPSEGEGIQELIRKADIAMYEAKNAGKNRVAVYDQSIKNDSDRRLDMEKNMREAALDGYREFEVYYQPIIDIQSGNVCAGAEALIRWNSTEMGFMSPADFIPLAEYLGLINPIGSHVLKTACEACRSWNDQGHPKYKVNVNLSVVQLLQPDIVRTISDILEQTKIDPRNLTLEVTEGLAINDLDRMKNILGQIKALGVRIALDDFGTGYSSLSHIRELPFDVIKVDQSFVRDLAEDTYSKSFIKMVSDLADAIDVSICVEGIETKQQYKVLEGMKVRMIQGYYFDKPMPAAQFYEKYVRETEWESTEERTEYSVSEDTGNLTEDSISEDTKNRTEGSISEDTKNRRKDSVPDAAKDSVKNNTSSDRAEEGVSTGGKKKKTYNGKRKRRNYPHKSYNPQRA